MTSICVSEHVHGVDVVHLDCGSYLLDLCLHNSTVHLDLDDVVQLDGHLDWNDVVHLEWNDVVHLDLVDLEWNDVVHLDLCRSPRPVPLHVDGSAATRPSGSHAHMLQGCPDLVLLVGLLLHVSAVIESDGHGEDLQP